MKKLGTILAITTLALTGCTSNDADTATETPTLGSIEDLDAHTAERFNGGAELHDGNLTITVESKGTELQDQDATLKALQDAASTTGIEYDTVTIAAAGTFGCRYDKATAQDAADGNIVVTNIWDTAEACTGTN